MAVIQKPDNKPLQSNAGMVVPARFVPSFRVVQSDERKARKNLLFRMHGGLGDVICAEPAVRYALNHFKDVKFSLVTLYDGLFQHLKFEHVFNEKNVSECNVQDYLLYENTDTSNELAAEFLCHTLMHGIDYASLYMWRMLLPRDEREIVLVPTEAENLSIRSTVDLERSVVIHPGKTWASRTFPKKWWDSVINTVRKAGYIPVIIGGSVDNGRASTIDVDTRQAIDLRFKLTLMETVSLTQQTRVLLTNDSAPLHMATSTLSNAWIGFLSTVKHPDHLLTYRRGTWAWRMQDWAKGGIYKELDVCPNKDKTIRVDQCDTLELLKWLPDPEEFALWAVTKCNVPDDDDDRCGSILF